MKQVGLQTNWLLREVSTGTVILRSVFWMPRIPTDRSVERQQHWPSSCITGHIIRCTPADCSKCTWRQRLQYSLAYCSSNRRNTLPSMWVLAWLQGFICRVAVLSWAYYVQLTPALPRCIVTLMELFDVCARAGGARGELISSLRLCCHTSSTHKTYWHQYQLFKSFLDCL